MPDQISKKTFAALNHDISSLLLITYVHHAALHPLDVHGIAELPLGPLAG
jgi:hypothetical protein